MNTLYYIITSLVFFYILGLPFIMQQENIKLPFKVSSSFMAYNVLILYGIVAYIKLIIYFISLLLGNPTNTFFIHKNPFRFTVETRYSHIFVVLIAISMLSLAYGLSIVIYLGALANISWFNLLVCIISNAFIMSVFGSILPYIIMHYFPVK